MPMYRKIFALLYKWKYLTFKNILLFLIILPHGINIIYCFYVPWELSQLSVQFKSKTPLLLASPILCIFCVFLSILSPGHPAVCLNPSFIFWCEWINESYLCISISYFCFLVKLHRLTAFAKMFLLKFQNTNSVTQSDVSAFHTCPFLHKYFSLREKSLFIWR